jgi:hypothetical protein
VSARVDEDLLRRLARESGGLLGELGVGPQDEKWLRAHAEAIASLACADRRRGPVRRFFYRLARRAARIAR